MGLVYVPWGLLAAGAGAIVTLWGLFGWSHGEPGRGSITDERRPLHRRARTPSTIPTPAIVRKMAMWVFLGSRGAVLRDR